MSNITLENWENARGEQPRRLQRGPKPVAQGQLLKATAWLDGDLCWHEGALGWRVNGQIVGADAAQIERAGRALDKLEARDVARATVAARREKWRLARKLGALKARDLDKLCAVSRRRNPAALKRLAPLLVLEALDVELPHSPARALLLAWPHSQSALESVVLDDQCPRAARELAAFMRGATGAQNAQLPKHLRGVAALGARLHRELKTWDAPQLLLCAARENAELAPRLVALRGSHAPFAPDCAALQKLARAHGIERALEIGEELSALELVWPVLPAMSQPEGARQEWLAHEARVLWRRAGRELAEHWRRLLPLLAQSEPQSVAPFVELSRALLQVAARVQPAWKGKGKRRRVTGVPRIESVALGAYVLSDMTRWINRLGNEAASASDPTIVLRLWHEVALHHACEAAAPRVREQTDCLGLISNRWFGTLKRNCQNDIVGLTRVARAGGLDVALDAWRARRHNTLGNARGRGTDASSRWPAPEVVESWLRVLREIPDFKSSPWEWNRLLKRCGGADARALLWRVVEATRGESSLVRAHLVEGLHWWHPTRAERRAVWPHFPAVMRAIAPLLGRWEMDDVSEAVETICEICVLAADARIAPAQWPAVAGVVLEVWEAQRAKDCEFYRQESASKIALALCGDELNRDENVLPLLRATLENSYQMLAGEDVETYEIRQGALVAQGRAQLARALRCGLEIAPARALKSLEYLAALRKTHQLDSLQILENSAPDLDESWLEIAQISPEIAALARDTAGWQTLAGEAATPPPGALKIVDWPRKWAREIEALQNRVADNPQLNQRLNNLRARLNDEAKWRAQQAEEIAQLLENASQRAAFAALECAIESAFRARLQALCGALPAEFKFDDDWFNALLLGSDIEFNRKWARALLRHEVAGQNDWRQQLPGNARFLAQLSERGVDVAFYLSEFARARGELWLWIENEPLGILQMGNRFNTCLSRGGCNSFSGVANAIELNKRVVYARDKKGHIVARQLWAISRELKLVGFDVYSTYAHDERADLEAHFAGHARQWARGCGLELADAGEIESLVAPSWYDDGVRAWDAAAAATAGAKISISC